MDRYYIMKNWAPDILGEPFERKFVEFPDDYSGEVRSAVVRSRECDSETAVLYVHGFSDYFFQAEMAGEFAAHGLAFYAVDLRRYGRSYLPGDELFRVRDLREYFDDINVAIEIMKSEGVKRIVLLGHSTGGLVCSYYMESEPDSSIVALILNSPFLTWNMSPLARTVGIPVLKTIGRIMPGLKVQADSTDNYAATFAAHLGGGEWEYDPALKPDVIPPVTFEWIRAIDNAQRAVRRGSVNVPVLLLHSDKSASSTRSPREMHRKADIVLDVTTMARVGRGLGPDVTDIAVRDGIHDLALSNPAVRRIYYDALFTWLADKFPGLSGKLAYVNVKEC